MIKKQQNSLSNQQKSHIIKLKQRAILQTKINRNFLITKTMHQITNYKLNKIYQII